MEWLQDHFNPGPTFAWMCAAAVLLLPLIWYRWHARNRHATLRYSSNELVTAAGSSLTAQLRFVVPLLRTLAIGALIFAMARPQSSGAYHSRSEGIAIQMVLDISGSMAEKDFVIDGAPVRRLDAVKAVFEEFVVGGDQLAGRDDDLIGMTTFAMFGDTACPLTLDHGSLIDLLRETEIPGWLRGQQVRPLEEANYTAIGDGLVLATDALRRAGEQAAAGVLGAEPAKSKVMILLTDGKNNPAPLQPGLPTSPSPLEAARVAAKLGIRIYTIGAIGTGRPTQQGFLFMQPRADVDEPLMQEIAAMTGGKYFRATDSRSLESIYGEIDKLERKRTGEREYRDNVRAATLAMLVAIACLMFELLLINGRMRQIP